MIIIENPELEGSSVPCIVHYTDGKTEKRTFCNTSLNVGLKCYRSKRRYYPLTSNIYNRITRIVLMQRNKKNTVETIRANATRFLKLLDNRLWPELREKVIDILHNLDNDYKEWESITDKDKNTFSGWFWDKYHEEWLYHRNIFMTVNTAFGKRFGCGPELSEDIKNYLNGADDGFFGYCLCVADNGGSGTQVFPGHARRCRNYLIIGGCISAGCDIEAGLIFSHL